MFISFFIFLLARNEYVVNSGRGNWKARMRRCQKCLMADFNRKKLRDERTKTKKKTNPNAQMLCEMLVLYSDDGSVDEGIISAAGINLFEHVWKHYAFKIRERERERPAERAHSDSTSF